MSGEGGQQGKAKPFTCSCRQDGRRPGSWILSELPGLDVGILLAWSRLTPLIGGAARCSHLYRGGGGRSGVTWFWSGAEGGR